MIPRLGINIDHVATLRQARGEEYPSVVDAAQVSLLNGADQITIHLREDRRHIQDTDVETVRLVTKRFGKPLNFEMGVNPEIVEIAIASSPEWICIVPEKRQEKTTEGGLDLLDDANFIRIEEAVQKLKSSIKDVRISLFLEAKIEVLIKATQLNIDAVEIHTGEYARVFGHGDDINKFIEQYKAAKEFLTNNKIATHAGHGLTDMSVIPLLEHKIFEEYNIGHWIICNSLFHGLSTTVKNLKTVFEAHPLK
ncbi:MAG: pyridoxine 5'-phosphate synthase [Bacteriovoracaceae bacterium]|nr:pyridoxine 5'-phosphate synthase [Bacteriovoracaceae bacterium]